MCFARPLLATSALSAFPGIRTTRDKRVQHCTKKRTSRDRRSFLLAKSQKVGASMDQDTAVAVLCEQVTSLRGRLDSLEKDVQNKFDRIETKLDAALKEMQSGRPTWGVAIALTGLTTVCTGLIVFVATRGW